MSEYGLKIKNYEAGSIYEYNLGVRNIYDYTNAMLSNSLFSDFIKENGLSIWKEESTRDIICIEFNYGSRSYEDEIKHLEKQVKKVIDSEDLSYEEKNQRLKKLNELREFANDHQYGFVKRTKEQIREIFYTEGVDIHHVTHNKKGNVIKDEIIHYKMLFRTPGKAKKGSCMFINEKLYNVAHNFLYMGIQLPLENSPIVEMGAYSSLITSSIVGKVQIDPKHILVLKDVDSFFRTRVISVETDENKHCRAVPIDNYEVKNTLFDGQALIDSSIFPEWGDGYILLRHHLCKMAAFSTHIQKFFRDYYGDDYETAEVEDMFGNKHLAKDILLITTDNAIKWTKFGVSYDYWCDWVRASNSMFGIVKTAHPSKLGEVQRMSYQMINSLDMEMMPAVVECSLDYIRKLKTDDDVFLDYLRDNTNFSNDYEVLVALVEQNRDFLRSEYFRARKKKIIESYVLNFKNGKIIQNADNLVIVGSPYGMLLHTVGEDPETDPTFEQEEGVIQCYTGRFDIGEYLAGFRSPFNSRNNLGYYRNVYHEYFEKYFDFGKQIIAVNMVHTDFQSRNNGSDQDSDSLYVTDQPYIVDCARRFYLEYPTIDNNIPKEKNHYNNTPLEFARVDNNLAAAQLAIGESSNLAQICLTYTYNFPDQKFQDYVCILSVVAQCAIDNAKRKFDIDLNEEIRRIKQDMDIKQNGYPAFWGIIRKGFNKNKINRDLVCPMNFIFGVESEKCRSDLSALPMSHFFVKHHPNPDKTVSRKIESLICKYSINLYKYNTDDYENTDEEYLLLRSDFETLIEDIRALYISQKYVFLMSWLIDRAFLISKSVQGQKSTMLSIINKNKSLLLKVLYEVNKECFLKCFISNPF